MQRITEQIIDDISVQGYAVVDDLLPAEVVSGILNELKTREAEGKFKKAGVGHGQQTKIIESVRGDYIHWINADEAGAHTKKYFEFIEQLKQELNRYCYLGLKEAEIHYAHYPLGTYYKRHLDRFKDQSGRKVTILLYLNEQWTAADGGELVVYVKNESGEEMPKSIRPLAGRFLCFMADEIEHEVLPSKRDRYSITGWMLDQLPML